MFIMLISSTEPGDTPMMLILPRRLGCADYSLTRSKVYHGWKFSSRMILLSMLHQQNRCRYVSFYENFCTYRLE